MNIIGDLSGVSRCPHCSVAAPQLKQVWVTPNALFIPSNPLVGRLWAAYQCTTCSDVILAKCAISRRPSVGSGFIPAPKVEQLFPYTKSAHADIPEPARTFLQQAYDTLHAPDAAAVMAGSAVDAMLKKHGLSHGSLYSRIDEALAANLLTKGMADWAHEVRLGSNRPRHADAEKPHVSSEEAKQSVDFAEALGNFLFVLTARITRGIEASKTAEPAA
ncbi:DUF4145 domain-containing protein [Bradyrhizobium sp. URHD0069]|uniref:DUF4145 domain-containing protein n=1 Tax=Bradyrhizobium sp. URHD0069 TaxID=1380355 RepID=UPI00055C6724|nr:DUF4145 domain-containing protein [Bradyrhizobium sp. URHD0069]